MGAQVTKAELIILPNKSYIIGAVCPIEFTTYWNESVQNPVWSENGIPFNFTQGALDQLNSKYNGKPLLVEVSTEQQCQCCDRTAQICPCLNCNFGKCVPRAYVYARVQRFWFGNRDEESKCPGICSCLCPAVAMACLACQKGTLIRDSEAICNVPNTQVMVMSTGQKI